MGSVSKLNTVFKETYKAHSEKAAPTWSQMYSHTEGAQTANGWPTLQSHYREWNGSFLGFQAFWFFN